MTKETFRHEMLNRLKTQRLLHPLMEQTDLVKFVFQGMLGVGHLLSDRERVTARIEQETEGLFGDPDEPLFEVLSPAWCRINLRRAIAEQIPPCVIAGLMLASHTAEQFSRKDVYDFCTDPDAFGGKAVTDTDLLNSIPDETWLPSHSALYRQQYHPAYRVVSTEWIPCMEIVRKIAGKQAIPKRPLITIDGPCASGKTTLALKLSEVFEAAVIHTDDFVVPHERKTADRLAIPGGNCDAERLCKEVVVPWKRDQTVKYRKYDCGLRRLLPERTLPECKMLIIEGSYCNLPSIREYADLRLFVDTPENIRMERLQKRESPESLKRFRQVWIPLENAYFDAYRLPDESCLVFHSAI